MEKIYWSVIRKMFRNHLIRIIYGGVRKWCEHHVMWWRFQHVYQWRLPNAEFATERHFSTAHFFGSMSKERHRLHGNIRNIAYPQHNIFMMYVQVTLLHNIRVVLNFCPSVYIFWKTHYCHSYITHCSFLANYNLPCFLKC